MRLSVITKEESMADPVEEQKYKYVALTIKKQDASTEEAVSALADLGDVAKKIEGWEIDSLSVNNYG